jgi:Leucine rich repeat variant
MSILPPAVIRALQEAELIQKHDRLCDLAAIDAIPSELLQILTLNNQISIAKQPTTAERILINLATNKNKEVRLSVFKNSNITMAVLRILSEDEDRQIRRLFRVHPNNPNRRSRPSPEWLRKLAQDNNHWIRAQVASNPATPIDVLEILADDPYHNDGSYYVRERVAANLITPVNILLKLSRDSSCFHEITRNPNTPTNILEELLINKNYDTIRAMASNPYTPIHILAKIACLYPNLRIAQAQLPYDYYQGRILTTPIPHFLNHEYLLQDIIALCRNPATPSDILEKLAAYKEYDRISIAKHQNTPISVLEKFSHLKASSKVKRLAQSRLRSIYRELAANPETSTEQLWEMLHHQDIEIRLAVLLHPQGLNLLLDRALQQGNSLNRFIAGLHPQLSAVQRDRLFYSDNWLDRLAIVCNPSTSIEYLQRLSQDAHELVRDIFSQKILN